MALLLKKTILPDERYEAWVRIAGRIYQEHVWNAWNHRIFRLLRAVFDTNTELADEGGFLFERMADNYLDSSLMLLRRELDRTGGAESLSNLLLDMEAHSKLICRTRYRARFPVESCLDEATKDRMFDGFHPIRVEGDPGADYFDPALIKGAIDRLSKDTKKLREFAERTKAHRTPTPKGDPPTATIGGMHAAIANVRDVASKYYTLLTLNSISDWEPVAQFDVMKPFGMPWVLDAKAVAQAEGKPDELQ